MHTSVGEGEWQSVVFLYDPDALSVVKSCENTTVAFGDIEVLTTHGIKVSLTRRTWVRIAGDGVHQRRDEIVAQIIGQECLIAGRDVTTERKVIRHFQRRTTWNVCDIVFDSNSVSNISVDNFVYNSFFSCKKFLILKFDNIKCLS